MVATAKAEKVSRNSTCNVHVGAISSFPIHATGIPDYAVFLVLYQLCQLHCQIGRSCWTDLEKLIWCFVVARKQCTWCEQLSHVVWTTVFGFLTNVLLWHQSETVTFEADPCIVCNWLIHVAFALGKESLFLSRIASSQTTTQHAIWARSWRKSRVCLSWVNDVLAVDVASSW